MLTLSSIYALQMICEDLLIGFLRLPKKDLKGLDLMFESGSLRDLLGFE
jgi:hypothetical protein